MNEAETRAELIDPALKAAGWGVIESSRVRREVIAPGRLVGNGKRAQSDFADYVLVYRGEKLAVIEAKKRSLPDTAGVGQAKKYAEKLETRFAYSTNGDGIYQIDMRTGVETYISQYLSPDELWDATFSTANQWRDRFADIPFETRSGTWEARYYQHNAIKHVLEAIVGARSHPANNGNRHRQNPRRLPTHLETLSKPLEPEPPTHSPSSDFVSRRSQHSRQPSLQRLLRLPR